MADRLQLSHHLQFVTNFWSLSYYVSFFNRPSRPCSITSAKPISCQFKVLTTNSAGPSLHRQVNWQLELSLAYNCQLSANQLLHYFAICMCDPAAAETGRKSKQEETFPTKKIRIDKYLTTEERRFRHPERERER